MSPSTAFGTEVAALDQDRVRHLLSEVLTLTLAESEWRQVHHALTALGEDFEAHDERRVRKAAATLVVYTSMRVGRPANPGMGAPPLSTVPDDTRVLINELVHRLVPDGTTPPPRPEPDDAGQPADH